MFTQKAQMCAQLHGLAFADRWNLCLLWQYNHDMLRSAHKRFAGFRDGFTINALKPNLAVFDLQIKETRQGSESKQWSAARCQHMQWHAMAVHIL